MRPRLTSGNTQPTVKPSAEGGESGVVSATSRIAATYGSTGGVVYTAIQAGCSGVLILGGLGLIVVALLLKAAR